MSAPTVLIIAGKEHALRWGLLAQYRLQSLPVASTFGDLMRPERAVAASINFGWACLPSDCAYPTPEAMIAALEAEEDKRGLTRLDEALAAALDVAFPGGKKAEAKKASTDSSPAPASSSG